MTRLCCCCGVSSCVLLKPLVFALPRPITLFHFQADAATPPPPPAPPPPPPPPPPHFTHMPLSVSAPHYKSDGSLTQASYQAVRGSCLCSRPWSSISAASVGGGEGQERWGKVGMKAADVLMEVLKVHISIVLLCGWIEQSVWVNSVSLCMQQGICLFVYTYINRYIYICICCWDKNAFQCNRWSFIISIKYFLSVFWIILSVSLYLLEMWTMKKSSCGHEIMTNGSKILKATKELFLTSCYDLEQRVSLNSPLIPHPQSIMCITCVSFNTPEFIPLECLESIKAESFTAHTVSLAWSAVGCSSVSFATNFYF